MYSRKLAIAAAALAVLVSGGMANAAPWDHDHNGWHRQHDRHYGDRHWGERGRDGRDHHRDRHFDHHGDRDRSGDF